MERLTIDGESPVDENFKTPGSTPSTTEHVRFCGNLPEPSGKAKYSSVTDSE